VQHVLLDGGQIVGVVDHQGSMARE
jgi:hypothetical protein